MNGLAELKKALQIKICNISTWLTKYKVVSLWLKGLQERRVFESCWRHVPADATWMANYDEYNTEGFHLNSGLPGTTQTNW